jgi:hypothetical protein
MNGSATDHLHDQPKKRLVTHLRAYKLTTGSKVELRDNGDLVIDGVVKVKIQKKTMDLIKELRIKTSKLDEKYDGYILIGRTGIHRLLTAPTRERDRDFWSHKGWDGEGRFVVLHLDDNPHNFNIDNLVNAPQALNLMLRKSTGFQEKSGKWRASFTINTGKQTSTVTLPSQAEALHAVDILKMELVPQWAREFVFNSGLNRPAAYTKYYGSIETLLARSSLYKKKSRQLMKQRKVSSSRVLTTLPFKNAPEGLKLAVALSNYPFDSTRDVLVYYKGAKGKEIYLLVERNFYEDVIRNLDGTGKGLNMDGKGYLYIGNHAISRMVLGLEKGSFSKNALQGCHKVPGLFGKLDNRKRFLKIGTQYDNNKDQHIKFYI